ncbi:DapH/DapD/GlmU-related protein [Deinococcus sp. KSM4-11]|uniref:DapH/DapD/GlmU-related protein n=1 Tax=Deinococcus sp. KSM4-11 TaxID=2568654 RepID=UPI001454DC7A|nr:DapH/DapD/GlmU-related protein [Deinococcus sp. KSM4-11]
MIRRVLGTIASLGLFRSNRRRGILVDFRSRVTDSVLEGHNRIYGAVVISQSSVGLGTYVAYGTHIHQASLGRYCSIGQHARIGGLGRHPSALFTSHPAFYSPRAQAGFSFVSRSLYEEYAPTTVGHNTWIGYGAVVLDGVNVGNNVIVAAGAVVAADVPDGSVVGGVPARLIRQRLEVSAATWWTLPMEELRELVTAAQDSDFGVYNDRFEHLLDRDRSD